MKVSIHTKHIDEIEVEIHCREIDNEVNQIYKKISSISLSESLKLPEMLPGYSGYIMSFLKPESILLFYTLDKKVYAKTLSDSYEVKYRLYEIENMIEKSSETNFIRVSNSEIVNFNKVEHLDLNLNGVVKINFINGFKTVISRRYTNRVMEKLGVKSNKGKI